MANIADLMKYLNTNMWMEDDARSKDVLEGSQWYHKGAMEAYHRIYQHIIAEGYADTTCRVAIEAEIDRVAFRLATISGTDDPNIEHLDGYLRGLKKALDISMNVSKEVANG